MRGACGSCGRQRALDPAKLPHAATLSEVESKLRCAECDEKAIRLRVIPRQASVKELMAVPTVRLILEAFPGATVTAMRRGEDGDL